MNRCHDLCLAAHSLLHEGAGDLVHDLVRQRLTGFGQCLGFDQLFLDRFLGNVLFE